MRHPAPNHQKMVQFQTTSDLNENGKEEFFKNFTTLYVAVSLEQEWKNKKNAFLYAVSTKNYCNFRSEQATELIYKVWQIRFDDHF
jgi:hypothetical protein